VLADNKESDIVSETKSDTMNVKITGPVPKFVDTEGTTRNLKEGDTVELPKQNAKLLLDGGLAERL
jgi:hypothetical protein